MLRSFLSLSILVACTFADGGYAILEVERAASLKAQVRVLDLNKIVHFEQAIEVKR